MQRMFRDMKVPVPVLGLTILSLEREAETMSYTIITLEQCFLCIFRILVHNFSTNVAATLIS
jgi:hypothetical protein